MRILIVKDEHPTAARIGRALTEEAFAVDIAYDGETALDLARLHEYDAIVLDSCCPNSMV